MLLMLALAQPAAALGTLDQSQTDLSGGIGLVDTGVPRPLGQTFTAGLSGLLDTVSLHPQIPLDGFVIQIRTLTRLGRPSGSVLASQTIVSSPPDTWVQIAFTTPATVTAGKQYAIVAVPPTSDGYSFSGSFAAGVDLYAGGTAVVVKPDGVRWTTTDLDLAFETYVTVPAPTATPIPSPAAGELPNTAMPGGEAMVPVATLVLVGLASSAVVLEVWRRRPRGSRQ
jgi:hypothetical protein